MSAPVSRVDSSAPDRGPAWIDGSFKPSARGVLSRLASVEAARRGIEVGPLKARVGLPQDLESNDMDWIGASDQVAFVELLAETLGDNLLGFHLALGCDLRGFGALYYIMASAATLGDALEREARYTALISEGVTLTCKRGRSIIVRLAYEGVERHLDRHQIEFWIIATVRAARQLTGRMIVPTAVSWMHHRGSDAYEINQYLGVRARFDTTADLVEFPLEYADLPLLTADLRLEEILLSYAEATLRDRSAVGSTLRTRVENAITRLLPHGEASQRAVAAELGLSTRSLARKLAAEGLTYRHVLNELRGVLALDYLRDKQLSIAQIAWLLGYAKPNAFSRAFRARYGRSPGDGR